MNLDLPKIGLRNIKTALSVCICIIILPNNSFYAAIAAVICTQQSVEHSVKSGINRLCGTLIGGIIGIILLLIVTNLHLIKLIPIIAGIGVSLVIFSCNLIKKPGACSISCIVLIAIMTSAQTRDCFQYAIMRTLETSVGIIVAIFVNKYVHPRTKKTDK